MKIYYMCVNILYVCKYIISVNTIQGLTFSTQLRVALVFHVCYWYIICVLIYYICVNILFVCKDIQWFPCPWGGNIRTYLIKQFLFYFSLCDGWLLFSNEVRTRSKCIVVWDMCLRVLFLYGTLADVCYRNTQVWKVSALMML